MPKFTIDIGEKDTAQLYPWKVTWEGWDPEYWIGADLRGWAATPEAAVGRANLALEAVLTKYMNR